MLADNLSVEADQSARRRTGLDVAAILLFLLITASFFSRAVALANHAPLWMDEVLAVWTAQKPNISALLSALEHGSEFSPPLYDLFLHGLICMGASSHLALRLPSIIAVYGTALTLLVMMRRRAGWPLAVLAASTLLCSGIFTYAVQARPYACLMLVFVWTIALWDSSNGSSSTRNTITIYALMTCAMAFHFYAIILLTTLCIMELGRSVIERRTMRWSIFIVSAFSASVILIWLPTLRSAISYSGDDVSSALYYARPTFKNLAFSYLTLWGWLAAPALVLLLYMGVKRSILVAPSLGMTALFLCLVPVGVFLFALFISHSYVDRYALAGTIGMALLMPWLMMQLRDAADIGALGLLLIMAFLGSGWSGDEVARRDRSDTLALVATAPGTLPIATGNGMRFFELRANSSDSIANRLAFLDLSNAISADPTNRHQVERWKKIDPSLRVVDARTFICSQPEFLLLYDPRGGQDDLPGWLMKHAKLETLPEDRPTLTLVRPRPCQAT